MTTECGVDVKTAAHKELLGGHSELDPPDPIPNSEVKRFSADGSVGFPHVRVGHRQACIPKNPSVIYLAGGFFLPAINKMKLRTKLIICNRYFLRGLVQVAASYYV